MRMVLVLFSILVLAPVVEPAPAPVAEPIVRYHIGDDRRWADPNWDDSAWAVAHNGKWPVPPFYSDGVVWVRYHLPVPPGTIGVLGLRQLQNAPSRRKSTSMARSSAPTAACRRSPWRN
ncbi:MAG: hypothetical protein JO182_19675 [Acidobacteriaceae bacterium]|nr:hypothetical protein [Acidobacteriaceae bacterium]